MIYTDEQLEVIECPAKTLIVNAFAGSGKTSTLIGYAQARPENRILYLAFNSAVAAEARTRFPRNVECKTSHSLAFAAFGAVYKHKLGNPRARDAVDYLLTVMQQSDMGRDKYFFAQSALRRVSSFFGSGSADVDLNESDDALQLVNPSGETLDSGKVSKAANLLWLAMQDKDNVAIQMPHDGYLKLYQLSTPDLSRFDTILLDEAQDTNPCLLNIINIQRTNKVIVGDRHQNIYGFRQSINAMGLVDGTRLSLTSSFRFGSRIADVANSILANFCNEKQKLKGLSTDRSAVKGICYLNRTNSGLFGRAVEMIQKKETPHFVAGVQNYAFDTITDTWKLSAGQKDIRDPFIRRFSSYTELTEYAESVDDREIKARMKIVKTFGAAIPRFVQQISQADTTSERATATLTTAHKAKGQEWDRVIMGDDFSDMMLTSSPRTPANAKAVDEKPLSIDEANLIYVAATRAKKDLQENDDLGKFMAWAADQSVKEVRRTALA